jgi:hypothetical protein
MDNTFGVLLCAYGKVGYGYAAFNKAASIRFYSPTMPITLITDGHAISHLSDHHKAIFTNIIVTGEAVTDPGGFKIGIYPHLPYDYTLFLDVDGLCLQPIEPLIERLIAEYVANPDTHFYRTHVYAMYDSSSPVDMPMMYWARRDVIWDTYGFTEEHQLPATQSSIQFIAKCTQAENFYKALNNNYHKDYIPLEALKHRWGGTQPDELYLNITLAQFGINPAIGEVMWFGDNGNRHPHQLKGEYYFLSLFGVRKRIKSQFVTFYDRSLVPLLRSLGYDNHYFKSHAIFRDKHANTFISPKKAERDKAVAEAPLQLQADRTAWVSQPGKKTIHLFTTYYTASSSKRQEELDKCLRRNVDNPYITRVYLLSECEAPFTHPKLEVLPTGGRITMRTAVEFANLNAGELNIVCNSDIYMDNTIGMAQDVSMQGRVMCLSRWEELPGGQLRHYSYEYSQDTWVWAGQLNLTGGEYQFGLLGCDNKFAYDVHTSGYEVFNPSRHIKTIHVHLSNVRNYSEATRLPRPYKNVPPCALEPMPQPPVAPLPKLLINQPGKVGDILKVLPIAYQYHQQGYEVHWLCPTQYHRLFEYVSYVKPVGAVREAYDKVIDISFGLDVNAPVHKQWQAQRHALNSFITLKYQIAGIPVTECYSLRFKPNMQRQQALMEALGIAGGGPYILAHTNSDYGTPITITSVLPVIQFKPVGDYTIFDWAGVVLNAKEVHCIDSSLVNFADVVPTTGQLHYYITDRVPHKSDRTLLQKDWIIHNLLISNADAEPTLESQIL